MSLYKEPMPGFTARDAYLKGIEQLLASRQEASHAIRRERFQPDTASAEAYAASLEPYREELRAMLGWPLTEPPAMAPSLKHEEEIATDELGRILRLQVEVMPGLSAHALLFLPGGSGPHPLIISQHGGQGTPELTASFQPWPSNYTDMTRRLQQQGFAVLAPQLMLWHPRWGPDFDRPRMDWRLKEVGGSITALEILMLQQMLTHTLARDDLAITRVGMCGLSYGGFYTLMLTALETRIDAALSSCYFNQRYAIHFADWSWFDSGHRFQDEQLVGLICPRPLFIEVGAVDHMFPVDKARALVDTARAPYKALGLQHRFRYHEHSKGHAFGEHDEGLTFLRTALTSDA